MAHPGWSVEILSARMPKPLRDIARLEGSNTRKLFEAWLEAWLDLWQQDIDDLETQLVRKTATGNYLRLWNRYFGAKAPDDVSDSRLRFHLALELLRRQGALPPDAVRTMVAAALGTSANQITLVENEDSDTGEYVPAQYYVTFDQSLLEAAGFDTEFAEAFADLDRTLDHIAGTGIKAFALTVGGAEYDTDAYDEGTYGS